MAVTNGLFLFEVVVEKLNSSVDNRFLVIKSDFSDIFSLELRDPKSMHIVIPEPPPPPPELPTKGKKKKPPKKPKKRKGKGKGPPPPPPEPEILSGQSVLFTSSAEVLTQNMKQWPMEISLWSKEEALTLIGKGVITWDPVFLMYLEKLYTCQDTPPAVAKDEYNLFDEYTGNLMARITIQVKLSYLTDRVVSSFRTLTEDPLVKKILYTGMNSKKTSYMCTLKTTDEEYEKNFAKIVSNYVKDKQHTVQPIVPSGKPVVYADFANAPGAILPFSTDGETCCMGNADKQPADKYYSPETYPDIDFICEYIRKIISSCNDNMRMLTPHPAIRPRVRATDIEKLCYCKQTGWPQGELAERFKKETQGGPCPVCIRELDGKPRSGPPGSSKRVLDIANIRGPCGRPDCRIARDIRVYLEKLVEEDSKEIRLDDIVGPCGSKECNLVDKIKEFLRHRGKFAHGSTVPGLGTQCSCLEQMQKALVRKGSCSSICSHECESESDNCGGKACPYRSTSKESNVKPVSGPTSRTTVTGSRRSSKENQGSKPGSPTSGPGSKPGSPGPGSPKPDAKPGADKKVFYVYYFTVEYSNKSSPPSTATTPATGSRTASPNQATSPSQSSHTTEAKTSKKYKYCAPTCPTAFGGSGLCSKSACQISERASKSTGRQHSLKCINIKCPTKEGDKQSPRTPSPADSKVELKFDDIHNPCCVKTCAVAEKVKDFIVQGMAKKTKQIPKSDNKKDPCFCDCECNFNISGPTTYCSICGGYEYLGDAVKEQPAFMQPHPCPIFHKLYDKKYLVTKSWSDEDKRADSSKSGKSTASGKQVKQAHSGTKTATITPEKATDQNAKQVTKTVKKKVNKFTASKPGLGAPASRGKYHKICHTHFDAVPKNMGWLWTAEDIPGMKPRPKWRPGAANKILVRRYRTVREGVDIILKKKRALLNRKKKIEMKPTLVVTKKDGEYTVQMEVFKKYSKDRLRYQYPYDEKPPLIYTIGKTEETIAKIHRQKERRERRESRRKSRMLQSTFRDKCQEICLKAYNQSIGLLPLPNPNNPECPCDIRAIKSPSPVVDSCSCSDAGTVSSSDTDGDDWVIEFTPPLATWEPRAKHLPNTMDNESQYTYLDYKVKCLDKQGNQVPRFFTGPDGNQECSDLGGFHGLDGTWLEINKDGYIGPDNRWVPQNFTGPDGLFYLSEEGVFTDNVGNTWRIGIDGYVDKNNLWQWYPRRRGEQSAPTTIGATTAKTEPDVPSAPIRRTKNDTNRNCRKPNWFVKKVTKPCVPPQSKKTVTEKEKPEEAIKGKNHQVMSAQMKYNRRHYMRRQPQHLNPYDQIEMEKMERYQNIMERLYDYDDIAEFRIPTKTNRAVDARMRGTRQISSKNSFFTTGAFMVSSSKNMEMQPMLTVKNSAQSARRIY